MPLPKTYKYYKVTSDREKYLGKRYFKFDSASQICIQVVCAIGEISGRGKSNMMGVYMIHKVTFYGNYLGCGYVDEVPQKEYEDAFEEIVKILR